MTTLTELTDAGGPFATVVLASPSRFEDAAHRLEVRWTNARRDLESAGFPEDDLMALDDVFAESSHDEGAAHAICRSVGGPQLLEHLVTGVAGDLAVVDSLPRLGPILESRQQTIAHVVVVADRAGAEITAFDAGDVVASDVVEGERLHIHRGHPGGWSQRRFQQRAENRWESNAGEVAEAVVDTVRTTRAELVAVAGDVRAVGFLREQLPSEIQQLTHVLEAGSDDGIAEETLRLIDDLVARRSRQLLEELRERRSADRSCVGRSATLAALAAGRVEHLLVHDDADDERRATVKGGDGSVVVEGRLVDVAIRGALATSASIRMMPAAATLEDRLGALLRW